ncbi:MAG: hypothetical protein ACQEWU_14880 [Bacillota bacterium]|uniref:Uncharacterized protein n=1 Tax=Virgibacillus salarius TaxID=447199 RepID=A0A941DZ70_9BACI|nr:hypothetical protein [Virgibacillus salarius]MBR7798042.1 hypothetical protein [Virgibacillus salarius]
MSVNVRLVQRRPLAHTLAILTISGDKQNPQLIEVSLYIQTERLLIRVF